MGRRADVLDSESAAQLTRFQTTVLSWDYWALGGAADAAVSVCGSMLVSRCVSGTRAVPRGKVQEVAGLTFQGFGAHHSRRAGKQPCACVASRA